MTEIEKQIAELKIGAEKELEFSKLHGLTENETGKLILFLIAKYEASKGLECHGYDFKIRRDGDLWVSREDGEGMALNKESLDRFWKEFF